MKIKAIGLLMAVAVLLGVVAVPASAAVSVGPDAGVFPGQAKVGKKGSCANDGTGTVSGGGLGLLPTPEKRAWYTITSQPVVSAVHGSGLVNLCGKLGPIEAADPVGNTGLGAACATSKGWDGKGLATFTDGALAWISNLGWKATAGGTFLVTGDVGGTKGKKADLLTATVQTLDEGVVVNCLTKSGEGKDKVDGATVFTVVAAYEILPGLGGQTPKKTGKQDPKSA